MKIVLVCPHFPPMKSGLADYTFKMATALADRGHEVIVFTSEKKPTITPKFRIVTEDLEGFSWSGAVKRIGADYVIVQYTPQMYLKGTSRFVPVLEERTERSQPS